MLEPGHELTGARRVPKTPSTLSRELGSIMLIHNGCTYAEHFEEKRVKQALAQMISQLFPQEGIVCYTYFHCVF